MLQQFGDVSLHNYLDLIARKPSPKFNIETDIPGFPFQEYDRNMTRYAEMEEWYSGEILEEQIEVAGKQTDRYPVKVNPLKSAVEKHTHFLFGQVEQDDRPLVNARMIPRGDSDSDRELAQHAEDTLAQVWWESSGRAKQWENGATSQVYGGCVFHVVYDPRDPMRSIPVRIDTVHPKHFVGRPDANDMFRLREAWIVNPISIQEARDHGVIVDEQDEAWMIQHYTDQIYECWVNDQPAKQYVDGEWRPLSGANEWGWVPVVYVPHIRSTGFYGENVIDVVKGVIKEMNLRVADYGDSVTVDSHAYLGMRNVNGAPTVVTLAPGYYAIDIGDSLNITGQDQPPDLFEIRKPSSSKPMYDLVEMLYSMYRRLIYVPAVLDGEDEGSQRSGLTLAMRMISLTAHTESERVFWTAGLILVNRMILRMLAQVQEAGISIIHATLRLKLEWAPILPRDREMVVQEAVALMAAKLGSPERLLELLGVDDTIKEKELILEFWEEITKMEAELQNQFGATPQQKGMAGSSTAAQSATKT